MQAMLLAAGFGTRLRPYTLVRPKPLFPVLNRPLLLLQIRILQQLGCGRILVNGHYLGGMIAAAIRNLPGVWFQDEEEVLGTGGGLRRALSWCGPEPLLVMNGDICHDIDIVALYNYHLRSGNDVTMALHDFPRFNTVRVRGKRITGFDSTASGPETLAFTGVHVVNPALLERIPPSGFHHIIDLYDELARCGGKIGFVRVDGSFWHDIGTPADYLALHRVLLTEGVPSTLPLPQTSKQWLCSPESETGEAVTLAGWGCLGAARIGAGAYLRDSVVWDGASVAPGTRVEGAVIT